MKTKCYVDSIDVIWDEKAKDWDAGRVYELAYEVCSDDGMDKECWLSQRLSTKTFAPGWNGVRELFGQFPQMK